MATGVPQKRRRINGANASSFSRTSPSIPELRIEYVGKKPEEIILRRVPSAMRCLWHGTTETRNGLYFGENAGILAMLAHDPDICGQVRIVYIDPPFATQTTFHSRKLNHAYEDTLTGADYVEFLRERIILLHRLLAHDGALYLHLDEKMVFHMKIVLDEVFGLSGYRNCITRKKCNPKNYTRKQYGNVADYILFYTKTDKYIWNRPLEPWTEERAKEYQYVEPQTGRRFMKVPVHAPGVRRGETGQSWRGMLPPPGKHWQFPPRVLDEMDARGEIFWSANGNPRRKVYLDRNPGIGVQDIWLDFRDAHNQNIRITGYPTEKNSDLLKRIIESSSNPGDLVLDCFAGCGTTMAVASQLGRRWIGVDNSLEAIRTTLRRFAQGVEPMGDFVGRRDREQSVENKPLDLFTNLECKPTPLVRGTYAPVSDFTFFVEPDLQESALPIVHDWERHIEPSVNSATPNTTKRKDLVAILGTTDLRLAPIGDRCDAEICASNTHGFAALADAIVSQQLSRQTAESICLRFKGLFSTGHPNAQALLDLSDDRLRTAGVSARKIGFLRDLAQRIVDGRLNLGSLTSLPDAAVIEQLTTVKGIGPWTAKKYLTSMPSRLSAGTPT